MAKRHGPQNRLDIHDEAQLRKAELSFSAARLATLELGPPKIGLPYLCHIHRTLFQDVYSWAGELRTLDIWRDETPFVTSNISKKRVMHSWPR